MSNPTTPPSSPTRKPRTHAAALSALAGDLGTAPGRRLTPGEAGEIAQALLATLDRAAPGEDPTIPPLSRREGTHAIWSRDQAHAPRDGGWIPGAVRLIGPRRARRLTRHLLIHGGPLCN